MKTNKFPIEYQDVPPLTEAVLNGNYKLIKHYLDNKVDVNEVNSYGITALMAAVFKNDKKSTRILIKAKAKPLLVNTLGQTASDIANDFSYTDVKQVMLEEIYKIRQEKENYQNSLRKDIARIYFSTTQSIDSIKNNKDVKISTPSLLLPSLLTSVVATTTGAINYAVENTSEPSESHHLNQIESSTVGLEAHPSEKPWWITGAVTVLFLASGIIGMIICFMRKPGDHTENQDKSTLLPDLIDGNRIDVLSSQSDDRTKNQEDSHLLRYERLKNRRDSVPRMSEIDTDTIELEKISREMDELLAHNESRLPGHGAGSIQDSRSSNSCIVEESVNALHRMDNRGIDKLQEMLACCRVLSATVDDSSSVNKLIDGQTTMAIISETHKALV